MRVDHAFGTTGTARKVANLLDEFRIREDFVVPWILCMDPPETIASGKQDYSFWRSTGCSLVEELAERVGFCAVSGAARLRE